MDINSGDEIDINKFKSEEVQEIVTRIPSWIIRWGMTVIFSGLLIILIISYFIKYPDLIDAKVVITTTPAPVTLVTRISGKIGIIKNEGETVVPGDLMGFLQSTSDWNTVLKLERIVLSDTLSEDSLGSLGDLETQYSRLLTETTNLKIFEESRAYDVQINQLRRQEETYKKLRRLQQLQSVLSSQEVQLAKEKFKTDSILFMQNVTSLLDFNQAKSTWLQQLKAAKNSELAVLNTELQMNQLSKQIKDLEFLKAEQYQKLKLAVGSAQKELLAAILNWKQAHLFIAPDIGKVAWIGNLENEKFIEAGKPIVAVIPEHRNLIAKAELPIRGSGKVKTGQLVNIKLENYPFEQFGAVKGKIISISEISNENVYLISIELSSGLKTTLSGTLPFKQQLVGTTEIITEDLTLLDRVFYQFRKLLSQRKK